MSKIKIVDLSFSYTKPQKDIFNKFNLEIDRSWKTILFGKNGRGKTTLLKLIEGKLKKDGGNIISHGGFTSFNLNDKLQEDISVLDIIKDRLGGYRQLESIMARCLLNFQGSNITSYGKALDEYTELDGFNLEFKIKCELQKLNLKADILRQKYSTLSGGEKTKVQLTSLFIGDKSFPIMDEPTNHLDIESKAIVGRYLKSHKNGFLCVSHDREFLDMIGNHVVHIHNKRKVKIYKTTFFKFEED